MKILVVLDKASPAIFKGYVNRLKKIMIEMIELDPDEVVIQGWEGVLLFNAWLDDHRPDITIICGEELLKALFKMKGITIHAGKILSYEGYKVMPVMSPGYLDSHPSKVGMYVDFFTAAYREASGLNKQDIKNQFEIVTTHLELHKYVDIIKQMGICSFDFETSKITDMATFDPDFKIRSLSMSYQQGSAIVINFDDMDDNTFAAMMKVLERDVFGNRDVIKVGQNTKFDMHCAALLGISKFEGQFHDTMLMHQLMDEYASHALKEMIRTFIPRYSNYENMLSEYETWDNIPFEVLAQYNALDSDLTLRLYILFTDLLMTEDPRLYRLYRNLSAPAMLALFKAEETGMMVDPVYLTNSISDTEAIIASHEAQMRQHKQVKRFEAVRQQEQSSKRVMELQHKYDKEKLQEYKSKTAQENQIKRLKDFETEISDIKSGKVVVHTPLNFGSPLQMNDLAYSQDGFAFDRPLDPITKEVKKGTGKEVLLYIKDKTGFVDELLAYRQMNKILGTYLEGIHSKLDAHDHIHTSFNQDGTKTGRLSSSKPNMQNMITRTKYKAVEDLIKLVKNAFVVPEEYTMLQADYSQAELRLAAHYSQDKAMMQGFIDGVDIHELTASSVLNISVDEFRNLPKKDFTQHRFEAKSQNFGLLYGMSAYGYQNYARVEYGLKLSKKKAEDTRDKFFETYPGLIQYHKIYKAKALKYGYVRTLFGRKCRVPDIESQNRFKRGHAERNAINSPIQGTAGELTIFAFSLLQHCLDPRVIFVNEVHDSIIYYVPNAIVTETVAIIKKTMENLPIDLYFDKELTLPMKADFEHSTQSWGQLESYV